ncbi:MAG: hypothetical protein ACWA6U_14230 [Breznakibacter sp.]
MKIALFNILVLVGFMVMSTACEDNEDKVIPVAGFEKTAFPSIDENGTAALAVKVTLSVAASERIVIPVSYGGTAREGVNYETDVVNQLVFEPGRSSEVIFITPVADELSQEDHSVEITLGMGDGFELASDRNKAVVVIANNPDGKPKGTEVSFLSGNMVTNGYLAETLTIEVALSEPLSNEVEIPLLFTGDFSYDDIEVAGLTDGRLVMPANEVSRSFEVKIKSYEQIGSEKNLLVDFDAPTSDDYNISSQNNSVVINVIDPAFDFSRDFFNAVNEFRFFFKTNATSKDYDDKYAYRLKAYRLEDGAWKTSSAPYVFQSQVSANSMRTVDHIFYKPVGWSTAVVLDEQARWEDQGAGLLRFYDFFPSDYLVGYNNSGPFEVQEWLRFCITDKESTRIKVTTKPQTLRMYKAKAGLNWKEQFSKVVDGKTQRYYFWYEDSRLTGGVLSNSPNVEPVDVVLHSMDGTYDPLSREIIVDAVISCSDPNFLVPAAAIVSVDEQNRYTVKYKITPFK